MKQHVTAIPWEADVKGSVYGPVDSYKEAAEWLEPCRDIADWGGGPGHFKAHLHFPMETQYTLVDGTEQDTPDLILGDRRVLADLADYHQPSDGILLRHVLEMTHDWKQVLTNAVKAFRRRMVIVTFTPHVRRTHLHTHYLTWPVYHFNHEVDLIPVLTPYLKKVVGIQVRKSLPERVYCLEKGR